MASTNVPLGFRFLPKDEELMKYLWNKDHGIPLPSNAIPEVDVYSVHPCSLAAGDREEKFYFVKMKRHSKNKNGKRPSRVQEGYEYAYNDDTIGHGGWWKATTGKKDIYSKEGSSTNLGFKRTLKFYSFKNKNKERREATATDWIMHEYNLNNTEFQEWVICGIKHNGKKSKAVGGTSRGEYLDDSCAALTTTITTPVAETMLASNEDQDITIRAGGGRKNYEDEEDLVRTQELKESWIEFLFKEDDQDFNLLHQLEVNSEVSNYWLRVYMYSLNNERNLSNNYNQYY